MKLFLILFTLYCAKTACSLGENLFSNSPEIWWPKPRIFRSVTFTLLWFPDKLPFGIKLHESKTLIFISIESDAVEIKKSLDDEINKRVEEYKSGKMKTTPFMEGLDEIRESLVSKL